MRRALDRLLGRVPIRSIVSRPRIDDLLATADRARDRRDWASAAEGYRAALAAGCANLRVHVQLGHALKELGRYDEAEAAYRLYLEAAPFDADIHLQLGHLFNRQCDPASALGWYERALRLSPGDVDVTRHVEIARREASRSGVARKRQSAMRLVETGSWTRARPILRELVDEDGEDDLVGILANVTKETGAIVEAADLYGRYLAYAGRAAPELLSDAELQMGHLSKVRGDHRSALKHYIRARDHARHHRGHVPEKTCIAEIDACISRIYPCFDVRPA